MYDDNETGYEEEMEDDGESKFEYMLTLKGCGKTTYWMFPDINCCPVQSCRIQFGVRYDAMIHYKKKHADRAILCPICEKPISALRPYEFIRHYNSMHPNDALPYDLERSPIKKVKLEK